MARSCWSKAVAMRAAKSAGEELLLVMAILISLNKRSWSLRSLLLVPEVVERPNNWAVD